MDDKSIIDDLRRYKAHNGRTYDDIVVELLENIRWQISNTIQTNGDN